MPPGTLCMRTTMTSGSCLVETVLTGKVTGAAAPCMVSWMVPADASCCLCCAEVSLKDRCTSALWWPLRTGAQPATWSCTAECSYIAAMAWLTTLRLLCLVAAEVAGVFSSWTSFAYLPHLNQAVLWLVVCIHFHPYWCMRGMHLFWLDILYLLALCHFGDQCGW